MSSTAISAWILVLCMLICGAYSQDTAMPCNDDMRGYCRNQFTEATQNASTMTDVMKCQKVQILKNCLLDRNCDTDAIVQEATVTLNVTCDNGGSGTVPPGTTSNATDANAVAMKIIGLLSRNNCPNTFTSCSLKYGITGPESTPSCSDLKASSECMFDDCPGVKGTSDEREVADNLVDYADRFFSCSFTANEILGNGSVRVLQRPLWELLMVLLVAMLMGKCCLN